ncbi:MAG: SDR family oxidoreductase [Candidatus Hydrogenedentes bacterium]|nr:SDR family oxidoreductase [Candidatus Hydrogenedentota bacterium]
MKTGTFAGKVVAITGAGGGIGAALCRAFAREGAFIALLDIDTRAIETVQTEIIELGARTAAVTTDVTNALNCQTAIEHVIAEFNGIDVLINNAGITHFSLCENTTPSVYKRVMDVNFFGAVHCTLAALPSLIERRGAIGVMSSIAGFAPLVGRAGYCASKHALHGYFETLRCEVKRHGVSVTMICPGFTRSNIERSALAGDGAHVTTGRTQVGIAANADDVAHEIVRSIARRKRTVILSSIGKTSSLIRKFTPSIYDAIMTRKMRAEFTRDSNA